MGDWYPYVERMQGGKGQCQYAAICGKNPVSVWAESKDKSVFPITTEEITNIVRVIVNHDDSIMATGVKIGGGKLSFTCLRLDSDILICQGKGENKDHSLVITLTNQAVLIGFNNQADVKTAAVVDNLEVLKDYIKGAGY